MVVGKISLSKVRKALREKAKGPVRLEKNVDMLVYLECILYLKELARHSRTQTQLTGMQTVQAAHVQRALTKVNAKFTTSS
eukprot:m.21696 g.21696  ORF g.21696 m.21696 type:complete len:81 (+) comp5379_c0_seq1:110-352(+)